MSGVERVTGERAGQAREGQKREDQGSELHQAQAAAQELSLDEVLADFRSSVHHWSSQTSIAAAGSKPRTVQSVAPRRGAWVWGMSRMAAGWALGCVLLTGGLSAGVWQQHRHAVQMAAVHAAEQERAAAQLRAQMAKENEKDLLAHNLLAQVDSDVSQGVPTAMEPLARLMVDADAQ